MPKSNNKHSDIIQHLSSVDNKLAKVIRQIGTYQLIPRNIGIEFFAETIIGQQLSKQAVETITSRFRGKFPKGLTPKAFFEKGREEVLSVGLSQRKYEYIFDLCSRIQNQSLDLDKLKTQTQETIRQQLKQVKGIGDWTVDMYLMFGLCHLDIFPIKDLAIRSAMSRLYLVSDTQAMLQIAKAWQPYRSVVSWYLYQWYSRNKAN